MRKREHKACFVRTGINFKIFRNADKSCVVIAAVLNAVLGKGGWTKTLFTTYRMIAIILSSNVLTLTTRPREISDALEKSLSFLSVVGFPVHEMATII